MTALSPSHLIAPEDFHEITGLRLSEIDKVAADPKLMEEAGCPWSVRIPTAPNAFPVVLIANDQLVEGREIQMQIAAIPERLKRFNKHDVSRA